MVFVPFKKIMIHKQISSFFPNLKLDKTLKAAELKTHTDIPHPDTYSTHQSSGLVLDPGVKTGLKNQCPADTIAKISIRPAKCL